MGNLSTKQKYVHQFKETARQDPYRSKSKPRGSPRCPICHSVSRKGRWVSAERIKEQLPFLLFTTRLKCPACRQLEDRYALGVIELRGKSWKEKKELVLNTIRHSEQIARDRNDQQRILWIQEYESVTKVYVTLPDLAQHIGRQLAKSFQGIAEYEDSSEEPYLRVRWESDLPHMRHRPGASLELRNRPERTIANRNHHKSRAFRTRSKRTFSR